MGRPLQRPTIKPLKRADGTVRAYRVTATVGGKQLKKVVPTLEAARALAAKWQGSRDASFSFLPTSLTVQDLRASEAWVQTCRSVGITPAEASLWFAQNYKKPGGEKWADVIEVFRQSRRTKHHLKDGDPDTNHINNLVSAVRGFSEFVGRDVLGSPSLEEVEAWLKTRGGRQQLLGDIGSFFKWCLKRGKIPADPTAAIERPAKVRGRVPTTLRPEIVAEHLGILEREAPEWVPYFAVCVFAFVRPGTRDGEASRVDADIREGRQALFDEGFFVRIGKTGGPRMIPWKFTGPLREWLEAYPIGRGLFPPQFDSPSKAERAWSFWRKRLCLSKDVLRHTGLSAAFYSGASQNELNKAADNSPTMQKDHYVGLWNSQMTEQLWVIRPKYSVTNRPVAVAVV